MKKMILIMLLLVSCQIEFDNSPPTCEEIETWYQNEVDEIWASCSDKCDKSAELKILRKEYLSKIEHCE